MFITLIVKLISVNVNFPDTVQNDLLSFRQIKISHILKCNLEAVKLSSHTVHAFIHACMCTHGGSVGITKNHVSVYLQNNDITRYPHKNDQN